MSTQSDGLFGLLEGILPNIKKSDMGKVQEIVNMHRPYSEDMRIVVGKGIGTEKEFEIMRFCSRSYINDWIVVDRAPELEEIAAETLVHLGKESYYELESLY